MLAGIARPTFMELPQDGPNFIRPTRTARAHAFPSRSIGNYIRRKQSYNQAVDDSLLAPILVRLHETLFAQESDTRAMQTCAAVQLPSSPNANDWCPCSIQTDGRTQDGH